jgi:general stress protein YciG
MGGTKKGGLAASETNKKLYGEDFYKRIGAKGGERGNTGGFFVNRELASRAGAIGGKKSRRGKKIVDEDIDKK